MQIACVLASRFALRVACARQPQLLAEPVALAPIPGEDQRIGEVSPAAEAQGVMAEMRSGEALSRCPLLRQVPPDPQGTQERWEAVLGGLEGIGAAVESEQAGEAFFALDGLCGIHGGEASGVLAAARAAVGMPIRIAVAPNRFAAFVAASRRPRETRPPGSVKEAIVSLHEIQAFLAPLPVSILSARLDAPDQKAQNLIETLRRLGIATLGRLAALPADQVADRLGPLGLQAHRLARGEDTPLQPRRPHEELAEEIELAEGTAGAQLDRALELLVDRLLADPLRRGRTVLGLRLSALLCGGGSWNVEQGLGRPTASSRTLCSLLAPRLQSLPSPAISLRLRALSLGPQVGDQLELSIAGHEPGRQRLAAALREVRSAQGAEALLKVLPVDSASRIPERRAILTPIPEP